MSLVSERISVFEMEPNWSQVPPEDKDIYDLFVEITSSEVVSSFSRGENLTAIVDYAKSIFLNLRTINPIWECKRFTDCQRGFMASQWRTRQVSFLKLRVERAIRYKKQYYENCPCGKITRLVLEYLGTWNGGKTPSIQYAEEWVKSIYD